MHLSKWILHPQVYEGGSFDHTEHSDNSACPSNLLSKLLEVYVQMTKCCCCTEIKVSHVRRLNIFTYYASPVECTSSQPQTHTLNHTSSLIRFLIPDVPICFIYTVHHCQFISGLLSIFNVFTLLYSTFDNGKTYHYHYHFQLPGLPHTMSSLSLLARTHFAVGWTSMMWLVCWNPIYGKLRSCNGKA